MATGNPYAAGSGSAKAWYKGWLARQRATHDNLREARAASGYEHPECEDCTEQIMRDVGIKVLFQLEYVGDKPTASEIVEALAEALPKEWWTGSNYADWGVVTLIPLNDKGYPALKGR